MKYLEKISKATSHMLMEKLFAAVLLIASIWRAPAEILVGNAPNVMKYAMVLSKQPDPIPVFLKRSVGKLEFVGFYRCKGFSIDPKEVFER